MVPDFWVFEFRYLPSEQLGSELEVFLWGEHELRPNHPRRHGGGRHWQSASSCRCCRDRRSDRSNRQLVC